MIVQISNTVWNAFMKYWAYRAYNASIFGDSQLLGLLSCKHVCNLGNVSYHGELVDLLGNHVQFIKLNDKPTSLSVNTKK